MLSSRNRPPRPQLTARIFMFALIDMAGLACVAMGGSWFVAGRGALLPDFPTSTLEAVVTLAGGLAVMFWAVAHILRELAKQAPEMHARYDAYIRTHHPESQRDTTP